MLRAMGILDDPVKVAKYKTDLAAGDISKYAPMSGSRDPFNSPTVPPNQCRYCDRIPNDDSDKLLRCSACKVVKYCDRECQKRDWKFHKEGCALLQSA